MIFALFWAAFLRSFLSLFLLGALCFLMLVSLFLHVFRVWLFVTFSVVPSNNTTTTPCHLLSLLFNRTLLWEPRWAI